MRASPKSLRRWFGAVCLLAAIGLLIAGETALKGRLAGAGFIAYWLVCLVLTAVAAGVALLDAAVLRREQRDEHRALIEHTLQEIERERRTRQEAEK